LFVSTPIASNRLLAGLPRAEAARFLAACERVELVFADVLARPGKAMEHVYFPLKSFISLLTPVDDTNVEVAMAGDEGMLGLSLTFGVDVSNVRALVQGAGPALRMTAERFKTELAKSAALRRQLGRYTFVMMGQLAQTSGCNRYHVVEQRLARWLLMTGDRAHSPTFHITHEFLAYILGVRRAGVTKAASALQERGLIQYSRGHVGIVNRKKLERASCACYRNDITAYDQAFA
jgi:CRP-like cAMP-binding protein